VLEKWITPRKLLVICLKLILKWIVKRLANFRPILIPKEIHMLTEGQKITIATKKNNNNKDKEEADKGLVANNSEN